MLITPDFVFVHMPKTGGSFVAKMLTLAYGDSAESWGRKHATCEEIPSSALGKPILSAIRSPWDRYVSQYHYGWWKTHPEEYCDPEAIARDHPEYPDVDFEAFLRIANKYFLNTHRGSASGFVNSRYAADDAPGWHTEQFVRFFCRSPRTAFAAIGDTERSSGRLPDYEYPVHFLRTERLNADLDAFLADFSVAAEVRARIRSHASVVPDEAYEPRRTRAAGAYFGNPALRALVLRREDFLFSRYPDYREGVA